jgi:signal transduction histidine kinase
VRPLGEVLGDFTLSFQGPRTGPRRLQDRPESRYLALAAGLVFMLLAGLLILWRGVRQERELARLKSDFVSNVSHELKTPLTSIRMFGEMLQQDLAAEPAQRNKYYGIIVAESERLGRLISNVLDFSRMERGTRTYAVEPQPLGDLVRDAVETFRNFREAEGFDLRLEADAGPEVLVDRDAVLQSIINLLTNAVKYSGGSRVVEVRVEPRPGAAVVAVRDQGIGIPRAEQRRVFEDFYRASNVRRGGTEGTGLGLALVRRHAQNMGGSVEVESVEGQGSTFRLILPLAV